MKQHQFIATRWFHEAVRWVREGSPTYGIEPARVGGAERRRHMRVKASFNATLSIDNRSLPVKGMDFHRYGAGVLSPIALTPGSVTFIHLIRAGLVGFAQVRHCTQRVKEGFAVGLEFSGELMPKENDAWDYQRIST